MFTQSQDTPLSLDCKVSLQENDNDQENRASQEISWTSTGQMMLKVVTALSKNVQCGIYVKYGWFQWCFIIVVLYFWSKTVLNKRTK
jgi:hypothetical protein